MDHVKFMCVAIDLSMQNARSGEGGPFGAVVVRNGKILGEGKNRVKMDNDPTAHGEVVAIRTACGYLGTEDLTGCVLYTSSEPCEMCETIIKSANISRVYYANRREDAAQIGFADGHLHERIVPTERLENEMAIKAFEAWAVNPNAEMYFKMPA